MERMFKGDGPLARAEREAYLAAAQAEADARALAFQAEREAAALFHTVTVTTRLDDEGTEDERRRVDQVRFNCSAPEDADCRRYPQCDCELFDWDDEGTHDAAGHPRIPGRPCWIEGWFDAGNTAYAGADADDIRDDLVPPIARAGHITAQVTDGEYLEWDFFTGLDGNQSRCEHNAPGDKCTVCTPMLDGTES